MKTKTLCIALIFTGMLVISACIPAAPTEISVTITKPVEGGKVDQFVTIGGNSQALPAKTVIWVVVYLPTVGRYYPQNVPADVQANGDWASITYIGQENDSGLAADIIVVIADKNAQDTFNAYLSDARDKSNFSGLEKLPKGAVIYDRISVSRR
jgi:hypothetical protein